MGANTSYSSIGLPDLTAVSNTVRLHSFGVLSHSREISSTSRMQLGGTQVAGGGYKATPQTMASGTFSKNCHRRRNE